MSIAIKSKFKILTKPSFRILAKIQLRNLTQPSAAKYWLNFRFKISPELQLQNLDQSAQSPNKSFMTKPQLPNLQQTVANSILIINFSNRNNLLSWHLHTPGSHQSSLLNGSESVSQWVSYWQGWTMIGLGPIKIHTCIYMISLWGKSYLYSQLVYNISP